VFGSLFEICALCGLGLGLGLRLVVRYTILCVSCSSSFWFYVSVIGCCFGLFLVYGILVCVLRRSLFEICVL